MCCHNQMLPKEELCINCHNQMLPKEELYMPPMNISVIDHRNFGRRPTVGVHVLKSLEEFRCEPLLEVIEPQVPVEGQCLGGTEVLTAYNMPPVSVSVACVLTYKTKMILKNLHDSSLHVSKHIKQR